MYKTWRLSAMLLTMLLPACFAQPDDTEQIRARITEMEEALEAGESRRFVSYIVEDFQGNQGINNRRNARAFVARQLVSQQKVRAQLGPVRVVINENSPFYAKANFEAVVVGGPRLMPDSGAVYSLETNWRKEDGNWMLVNAHWERGLNEP